MDDEVELAIDEIADLWDSVLPRQHVVIVRVTGAGGVEETVHDSGNHSPEPRRSLHPNLRAEVTR